MEREDGVGGNWYFGRPHRSVFASNHLISSKRLTEYTDFPTPEEWRVYPSQRKALEYLRAYARNFGLYHSIEFNTTVERIEPADDCRERTSSSLPSAGRAGEGGDGEYQLRRLKELIAAM